MKRTIGGLLFCAALGICLIGASTVTFASIQEPGIDEMCESAELIVEGEWLGQDTVTLTRVHKGPDLFPGAAVTLEVVGLSKHERRFAKGTEKYLRKEFKGRRIDATRVVLFLERDKNTGQWCSIFTNPQGSAGVFWYDDKACFGYQRLSNPGYMFLAEGREPEPSGYSRSRVPKNIEVLRAQIVSGLEKARVWRQVMSVEDPTARAKALAAYLVPRTAPAGTTGRYGELYHGRAREQLRALGPAAVAPLTELLRSAEAGDDADPVVRTLGDIGPTAKPAVPLLIALLTGANDSLTWGLLGALGRIGDPQAIEHVRPFLKHQHFYVVAAAATALAALNDKDSFDALLAVVQNPPDLPTAYPMYDMLTALYRLDPERARPVIAEAAEKQAYRELRDKILAIPH